MGTHVANVQQTPHCVEPEGLHWLKASPIMEPQPTPPPLPPRAAPQVRIPSGEIHGLQVDDEAVGEGAEEAKGADGTGIASANAACLDSISPTEIDAALRGQERSEGSTLTASASATRASGTEPETRITQVTTNEFVFSRS